MSALAISKALLRPGGSAMILPSDRFTYDPYEWFDPETGRPLRARLTGVGLYLVGCRRFTVKWLADYLESLCGARSFSQVPLEVLPIVAKAIGMLGNAEGLS